MSGGNDLSGSVALVTGAGSLRSIGGAIAVKLANAGAMVAVTDIDGDGAKGVAAAIGERAISLAYNVADREDAQRVTREVEARLGGIDILVNNAGVSSAGNFIELDHAEWDRVLGINLGGVFNTCRAVLPGMVARNRGGKVVNMGSIASKTAMAGLSAYCSSKFAILGLTQAIAAEMAPHGITVNSVCPGVVNTPMHEKIVREFVAGPVGPNSLEDADSWTRSQIPLGRMQTVEDIAEMVFFLVSDKARNITAASFHVDGGLAPR